MVLAVGKVSSAFSAIELFVLRSRTYAPRTPSRLRDSAWMVASSFWRRRCSFCGGGSWASEDCALRKQMSAKTEKRKCFMSAGLYSGRGIDEVPCQTLRLRARQEAAPTTLEKLRAVGGVRLN